jgi:HD-GYP domain-containing protein (c-di-GMP phosphodiesterase class II)
VRIEPVETTNLFFHTDTLDKLSESHPLSEKLRYIHETLHQRYPFIERLAIALYDPKTDLLKTFIHSNNGPVPLSHYEARLSEAPSLQEIIKVGKPRVINDLSIFRKSAAEHSKRILSEGYAASYTLPMLHNGELFGFIFFNAMQTGVFSEEVLHHLDLFGHLLALSVIQEVSHFRTLQAAVYTARDITHHRDNETGAHLDRMSRFARLIARELAEKHGFSDEYVEQIFLFSPLHDIGKIAIPDEILLKPGRLTEEEFEIMKGHTTKGKEIIDGMLDHFGIGEHEHCDIPRNITHYHHETLNGVGYPEGLQGEGIPIEARIIAVADIFDALTSKRPYKEAWPNEKAFELLRELSGTSLDADCVNALLDNVDEVERIQQRFRESPYA